MDMPDPYEGDPADISNWIRSMEVYFQVVNMDNMGNMILMMLQRIQKGKGNQAGTYSAVKMKEWINVEGTRIHTTSGGRNDVVDGILQRMSQQSVHHRNNGLPTSLPETTLYILGGFHHKTSGILHDH